MISPSSLTTRPEPRPIIAARLSTESRGSAASREASRSSKNCSRFRSMALLRAVTSRLGPALWIPQAQTDYPSDPPLTRAHFAADDVSHITIKENLVAHLRVAVHVGGTFTDICIFDENTQSMRVTKVPSTPDNPMDAVLNRVRRANIDLADVELLSHCTTVATNAIITRRFPKA